MVGRDFTLRLVRGYYIGTMADTLIQGVWMSGDKWYAMSPFRLRGATTTRGITGADGHNQLDIMLSRAAWSSLLTVLT